MPGIDWQFVMVTLIALAALWVLVRRIVPQTRRERAGATDPTCAHCPSNERARKPSPQRAARTGTTPVVSLNDLRETARKG